MISLGIVMWSVGELVDSLSAPQSFSEAVGYILARFGLCITGLGAAVLLWNHPL